MGFMNLYKKLDNLCRDMNGIGITGYIEDMEHKQNGAHHVPEWKDDYYQLKHYRYIRNQIAHENYADEENMCSDKDEIWIENFYHRIMTQSDPLALYYKVTNPRPASKPTVSKVPQTPQYAPAHTKTKNVGCSAMMLLAIAVAAIVLFVLFS